MRIGCEGSLQIFCCHGEHLMEKKMLWRGWREKGGSTLTWLSTQPPSTLRLIKWQNSFTEKEAFKCSQPSRSNHINKWKKSSQCLEWLIRSRESKHWWLSLRSGSHLPDARIREASWGHPTTWALIYLQGTAKCFMNIINDSQVEK